MRYIYTFKNRDGETTDIQEYDKQMMFGVDKQRTVEELNRHPITSGSMPNVEWLKQEKQYDIS